MAILIVSMLLSGLFAIVFSRNRHCRNLFLYSSIAYVVVWSSGVWILPRGFKPGGVPWVALVGAGLAAMLLFVVIPGPKPVKILSVNGEDFGRKKAATALAGAVFSIVLAVLVAAMVIQSVT